MVPFRSSRATSLVAHSARPLAMDGEEDRIVDALGYPSRLPLCAGRLVDAPRRPRMPAPSGSCEVGQRAIDAANARAVNDLDIDRLLDRRAQMWLPPVERDQEDDDGAERRLDHRRLQTERRSTAVVDLRSARSAGRRRVPTERDRGRRSGDVGPPDDDRGNGLEEECRVGPDIAIGRAGEAQQQHPGEVGGEEQALSAKVTTHIDTGLISANERRRRVAALRVELPAIAASGLSRSGVRTTASSRWRAGMRPGTGMGPSEPPIDTKLETKSGALPEGKPLVQISTRPCTTVPMPRVTISGAGSLRIEASAPLTAPISSASAPTIRTTTP